MPPTTSQIPNRGFDTPCERQFSRVGAAAAVLGLVLYATAAVLHPWTPPHETEAAFAHYAREPLWGVIHLAEFLGILAMCVTGLALAWRLRSGAAGVWGALGAAAMLVFASVYAIFAAVDGVALGVMVRRVAAESVEQNLLFETAYAVRQVEAGLFGLQWFVFGLGAGLFAPAFVLADSVERVWRLGMSVLSGLAAFGGVAFGVVQAQTGFSELSMAFQAGIYVGALWILAAAAFRHRFPVGTNGNPETVR